MPARDAHAQDAGPDREAQGWLQLNRLTVDGGGQRMAGVDVADRRRPLPPRPGGPVARRRAGDRDSELAVVDQRARAGGDRAAESIAVVGDEDRRARAVLLTVRLGPPQLEPGPFGAERVRDGVEDGAELRVAVPGALDGVGVE